MAENPKALISLKGAYGEHLRQAGGVKVSEPAQWEILLSASARRCLALLRMTWSRRPTDQAFVVITFDDFVHEAGVSRSAVRRSLDVLMQVGLIEPAGFVGGRRGHPRNAFRLRDG
jgi:hypothetical protein